MGGGAAGLIASWRAASLGAKTLLLEKTARLGTKILISGGGKCNITHDGETGEILNAFRPFEARFLRQSAYRFGNREILRMIHAKGIETYARADGRIFPAKGSAKDVVGALAQYPRSAGVQIRFSSGVTQLLVSKGAVVGVEIGQAKQFSSRTIVATGGASYPGTGTTGDAYEWMRNVGHCVVPVRAALAPIYLTQNLAMPPAGVSLRSIILKARFNGKVVARSEGDLLFTHKGISGPATLDICREVGGMMPLDEVRMEADLMPHLTPEAVGALLLEAASRRPTLQIGNLFAGEIPDSVVQALFRIAAIDARARGSSLTRQDRNRLGELLKSFPLGTVKAVPMEKGECVAGGVALDEVCPKTMQSLKIRRLYVCGELLDIAGPVGGYNLFAAFATGFAAGDHAGNHSLNPDN